MRHLLFALLCTIAMPLSAQSPEPLKVVATMPDLADLARRLGGPHVEVQSLTRGTEDLHLVRIRPSQLVMTRRAELFLQIGLDLEHAWVPGLLDAARNPKIRPGSPGFVNCAGAITPLGGHAERARSQGIDLHTEGNPHYNSDPERMRLVARAIANALRTARPAGSAHVEASLQAFERELDERMLRWRKELAPYKGQAIIDAHDAWSYFAAAFDFKVVAHLEPGPGMPPTPSHLARVIAIGREHGVRLIFGNPEHESTARRVASELGATALILANSSTEGDPQGWFGWMDGLVAACAQQLRSREGAPKE